MRAARPVLAGVQVNGLALVVLKSTNSTFLRNSTWDKLKKENTSEESLLNAVAVETGSSVKLPTYPSPNPTFLYLLSLIAKCWVRGGVDGEFPRNVE